MSLHTQAETARHLVEEKHAHYLMIIKANQPSLPEAVTNALAAPTLTSRAPHGPKKAKDTAAARSAASAPSPPQAPAGRTPPRSCASTAPVVVQVRMGCGLPLPMALGHAIHERAVPTQQQSSGSIDA